jgi:hypothetical protein
MSQPRPASFLEEQLRQVQERKKRYASFFESTDKQTKEVGIVGTLLEAKEKAEGPQGIRRLRATASEFPDCEAVNAANKRVGYEVTELVKRVKRGRSDLARKEWSEDEVVAALNAQILRKDIRSFGNDFAARILVIHTDEPLLLASHDQLIPLIEKKAFGPVRNLDEAYLLFSYWPGGGGYYPFVRLRLILANRQAG